jgi:hypothetical protein
MRAIHARTEAGRPVEIRSRAFAVRSEAAGIGLQLKFRPASFRLFEHSSVACGASNDASMVLRHPLDGFGSHSSLPSYLSESRQVAPRHVTRSHYRTVERTLSTPP